MTTSEPVTVHIYVAGEWYGVTEIRALLNRITAAMALHDIYHADRHPSVGVDCSCLAARMARALEGEPT